MKYATKLKLKLSGYWILSVFEVVAILAIGYLAGRLLEMAFTLIGFFILRKQYEKQYHAKSLIKCGIISMIVMSIVAFIEIPKTISILCSLLLSLFITWISYYVRDYLDLIDMRKAKRTKITKGISESSLKEIMSLANITEVQKDILIYYYCNRYSISKISRILHYSYDYIVELKKNAMTELSR